MNRRHHLARLALLLALLAAPSSSQNVLVYGAMPTGGLNWYSGFGSLSVTTASEAAWSSMTTAQFASYDLIYIGGPDHVGMPIAPYGTLNATKNTWSPAVTGRVVVTALHIGPTLHPRAGAMQLMDNAIAWLLADPGGTSLLALQDTGVDGMNYMSEFGVSGCTGIDCFNNDVVRITAPAHPVLAGITEADLSGWNQSAHNQLITYDPRFTLLAEAPTSEFLLIAWESLPRITTRCLPCVQLGVPFSFFLEAEGGVPPYTWNIVPPPSLPAGVTLDPMTGELAGVLTAGGAISLTVEVADARVPPETHQVVLELGDCGSCAATLCGDCDGDRRRTVLDALFAARYAAGLATFPTLSQFENCNVTGALSPDPTAEVTLADTLVLAQYHVGLISQLTCCSAGAAKVQELLDCGEAACNSFTMGDVTADLSDLATTHFYAIPAAPPGRRFTITVTPDGMGDMDLYVGAPGTMLGDEVLANYAYAATGPSGSESITIDSTSMPHPASDYVGLPIAIAVKSVSPDSYTISIDCDCDSIPIMLGDVVTASTVGLPDTTDLRCGGDGPELTYELVLSQTVDLVVTTDRAGTTIDTLLALSKNGCDEPRQELECDDDGGSGVTSEIVRPFTPPGTYTIIVDSRGAGGAFELEVTGTPSVGCSPLEGVIPPSGPFPHVEMGNTMGAMDSSNPSCSMDGPGDHVYEFTPTSSGRYRIDTCGSSFGTVLEVREGNCIAGTVVGCNVNGPAGCIPGSELELDLLGGTTYTILVDGVTGASGNYVLTVDALATCVVRIDDDLSVFSLPIAYAGDTTAADASFSPACAASASPDHVLQFRAPSSGTYCFDTCGSSFDTILEVYEKDCTIGALIGCNDDGMMCAPQSQLPTVNLVADRYYFVRVSGRGGAFGAYTLNITNLPTEIPFIDPVLGGHPSVVASFLDESTGILFLPFAFPFWNAPASMSSTTLCGVSSNGALRMRFVPTSPTQNPLWTYAAAFPPADPTIHVHGSNSATGLVYGLTTDPSMVIVTWDNMFYGGFIPDGWTTQLALLPSGDFQIRQVVASSDPVRTIGIGYSDGVAADNSVPGATGIDWDAFPVGVPMPMGFVDLGSSEPGGMAAGVVLYFQFGPAGYTVTRLQ